MNKKKVLIVFGTRPEAIKMCPLYLQMKSSNIIHPVLCLTGQHDEMLIQVMDVFKIQADYNLKIMKVNQTLEDITSAVLKGVGDILRKENPSLVLVHGDTTTSFAATLAAFYMKIPVGHIEAGLRTYNMMSPYPEEFNRQSVDIMCNYYYAPTERARSNLIKEGKKDCNIYVTGNTVIDALKYTVRDDYSDEIMEWVGDSRMLLVTAHRRESWGDPLRDIFKAIRRVVEENSDIKVVFPVHRNPVVRNVAEEELENIDRIRLIDVLDVVRFHNYMSKSYLIVSDSGGVQEEAPSLDKPVLVIRDETERPEGIDAGALMLVGTKYKEVYTGISRLLNDDNLYKKMCKAKNPYGDGHASEKICISIEKILSKNE